MKIGNVETKSNIFLAPMAGWTDFAYRKMCSNFGAGLVTSEMVSALGMHYYSKNTQELLITDKSESPNAVQIFGSNPEIMGETCKNELLNGFDIIDINMGCPVPKIVKNGEGSALMKDLVLSSKIIETCKNSTEKPITVKCRLGFDCNNKNVLEFAKMCQDSGADAITIHGRFRSQFYSGSAIWDDIFEVADILKIPVIANGDIKNIKDYNYIMTNSHCSGVAIGRASIGKPWIFAELLGNNLELNKEKIITTHCNLLQKYYNTNYALTAVKKNLVFYISNLKNASFYRDKIFRTTIVEDALKLAIECFDAQIE